MSGIGDGRLSFRPPLRPATRTRRTGRFDIRGFAGAQPAAVYVPPRDDAEPLRLVVMLHGAGGAARSALGLLRREADRRRLLLLAPKSTARTWDLIAGGYGPDVRNIDRLLAEVTADHPVSGYTVGGFSDGASYALSLGLANGHLFDSVIAFSPGFRRSPRTVGRPRIFVSHGTEDRVLRIDRCSRRIVQALRNDGHEVAYHEFEGGHTIPTRIQRMAAEWLLAGQSSQRHRLDGRDEHAGRLE